MIGDVDILEVDSKKRSLKSGRSSGLRRGSNDFISETAHSLILKLKSEKLSNMLN